MVMLMCWMALLPREAVATGSPAIMQGASKISTGNTVWFGNHYTSWSGPIQWRVMGNGNDGSGNSRLFLSSHVFDIVPFKPQDGSNGWLSSFARGWCIHFHHNAFSDVEKAALIETSIRDAFYTGKNASFDDTVFRNDRVFFLSAEEAEIIYFPKDDDSSRIVTRLGSENPAQWWLRSPVFDTADYAGAVDRSGEAFAKLLNWKSLYARPAFNFNLSSVLLTSAAEGGKLSGSTSQDARYCQGSFAHLSYLVMFLDSSPGENLKTRRDVRLPSLLLSLVRVSPNVSCSCITSTPTSSFPCTVIGHTQA